MRQVVTRVDDAQYEEFRTLTASLGTTAADALRMFIHTFNDYGGFPYPVRKREYVPFESDDEAEELMDELSMEVIADEAR